MDLKELYQNYKENIEGKEVVFYLGNGQSDTETFSCTFDQRHFCHLLGITKCFEETVPFEDIKYYKGAEGVQSILDDRITIEEMKKNNLRAYENHLKKVEAFQELIQLFRNPGYLFGYVDFNRKWYVGSTSHSWVDNNAMKSFAGNNLRYPRKKAVVLFGRDKKNNKPFPLSFMLDENRNSNYLDNQTIKKVSKIDLK